jgi:hypothetical protein
VEVVLVVLEHITVLELMVAIVFFHLSLQLVEVEEVDMTKHRQQEGLVVERLAGQVKQARLVHLVKVILAVMATEMA